MNFKRPTYWSKESNLDAYAQQSAYIRSIESEKERAKPKPAPKKFGAPDRYGICREVK